MRNQKLLHCFGLVRREVVADDMDLFTPSLVGEYVAEESNELRAGMPCCGLAQNLASLSIESSVQGQRAMAIVFEPVPLHAPRRQRQHWIESIQCFNSAFLIDAEHRCVSRRIQIQTDDIGRFILKVWII